jgi:IPT/TIG domain
VVKPTGGGAPSITSLSPIAGPAGTSVTITGSGLGSTQGTSPVTFNGTAPTPTSWSAASIVALVPSRASTGPMVVTVGGVAIDISCEILESAKKGIYSHTANERSRFLNV